MSAVAKRGHAWHVSKSCKELNLVGAEYDKCKRQVQETAGGKGE